MEYFLKESEKIKDEVIGIRRRLHENPELGYEEYNTSKLIQKFLKDNNIEYRLVAGTGVYGIIRGKGNKTVALRADMDALPITEKNNCKYASKNRGKMHACGHDGHTAILLGTAKLLNLNKDKIHGNVVLLFEPAEETVGGAKEMIKEKVLDSPHVDGIIGLHVNEEIPCGCIGIKTGVVHAASNPFHIRIVGKGGHGAHPDTTVDPIIIAVNVINTLQTVVSREIPPTDPAVITIGSIHGGTAENIIPEEVEISGIIRTMKSEHREYVKKRLKEIVEGITHSMRGNCEIRIDESYPCLYNDKNMENIVKNTAVNIIGNKNVIELTSPSMGVESFAYFSMERPSAFYFLGCRNEEKGIINPAHGSLFDIDEDCLELGVAIQASAAVKFLDDK